MGYRHVIVKADYADLASGAVLRSAPGFPAFPVRLTSEIFQRALALRGGDSPAVVWDPCCGSGYLLSVIGLLHRRAVSSVLASDLSAEALGLARENLSLLDPAALEARAKVLEEQAERFAKPSYLESADAARRLARTLTDDGGPLPAAVHRADAFDRGELAAAVAGAAPDIVVTDVPYGEQTEWLGAEGEAGVPEMLAAVASVLPGHAVLAVTVRGRKVPLGGVRPKESFKIGTRAVALLTADQLRD
ncbi:SAM-dependent methyltransferase [Kitasatospora sp. MAP12-15]|uniref:rRNA methyltransferase n=1 Tax=unclassified Kitasatospora TaxID=2633591 RepID=UPI0024753DEF|nr:rRNA methyltransferase [Kitasatospora sp. MAP12-44]MDH6112124.1 SAM-dependent methyltransferase [Kitasatospora sp. MAP12-44]